MLLFLKPGILSLVHCEHFSPELNKVIESVQYSHKPKSYPLLTAGFLGLVSTQKGKIKLNHPKISTPNCTNIPNSREQVPRYFRNSRKFIITIFVSLCILMIKKNLFLVYFILRNIRLHKSNSFIKLNERLSKKKI